VRRHLVLDTGPLGIATKPDDRPDTVACLAWLDRLIAADWSVILPEIADYELRRQLLLNGNHAGIRRLDLFGQAVRFEWINRLTLRLAARFWADLRREGRPTADPHALDGDCILAAQASLIAEHYDSEQVVVATTNVGHLGRFAGIDARQWNRIEP
jgi:predicted nucleic acid-binding protein